MAVVLAKDAVVGHRYRTVGNREVTVLDHSATGQVLLHVHFTGTEVPVPGHYALTPLVTHQRADVATLRRGRLTTSLRSAEPRDGVPEQPRSALPEPTPELKPEPVSAPTQEAPSVQEDPEPLSEPPYGANSVLFQEKLVDVLTTSDGGMDVSAIYNRLSPDWPPSARPRMRTRVQINLNALVRSEKAYCAGGSYFLSQDEE